GIDKSIDGIRAIAARTKKLDEARVKVVDVVQNLTAIAEENAASTEETSASAAEVGSIISSIAENAKQLNKIANEMEENIKLFVVE
ncbi:MAG: methyl-accepting chemotaxis protein, partial [Lachnospiraceae bacterium]|nr:methyl-accepting chemotaxis protein [Lachnospiraceae bacterium]